MGAQQPQSPSVLRLLALSSVNSSHRAAGWAILSFAQSTYNASLTLALLLLIMVFVFVLFALAGRAEKRLLRWH
jgi:ABC-type nitrate/sulfonate/bicarbonate transport system permease component